MPTNTHDDQRPPGIRPRDGVPDLHGDDLAILTRHTNKKMCIYCNDTGVIDDDEMVESGRPVPWGQGRGATIKCFYCEPTKFDEEE